MYRSGMLMILVFCVSACSTTNNSRYSIKQDRGPSKLTVDLTSIPEPTPVDEPKSSYGNPPKYQVWGKTYSVMDSAEDYEAEGVASWYGEKFHGHRTSNGEVYDMYQFTAAHKNLPLPTFVRVTNVDNGKSVVVRVNDRGPFYGDRIIDLSYAAAARLGYADKGTANVKVEAIDFKLQEAMADARGPISRPEDGPRLQIRSYLDKENAKRFVNRISKLVDVPVYIEKTKVNNQYYHRVKMGPMTDDIELQTVMGTLSSHKLGKPILIRESADTDGTKLVETDLRSEQSPSSMSTEKPAKELKTVIDSREHCLY